jgi:single-strand DNA-binding protein
MNNITIAGNVGRDPELKYTPANLAILKFSVADTSGKDDNKKTTWHDIVVFGEQAESVADKIGKGVRVIVIGRLQIENFEKKDGTKGKRVEVIADEVGVSLRWGASDPVARAAKALHADVIADDEEPF